MSEYGPAELEPEQELRDIAEVLKITANTDRNIQNSMEAILRIADRLERKREKCGKEEKKYKPKVVRARIKKFRPEGGRNTGKS